MGSLAHVVVVHPSTHTWVDGGWLMWGVVIGYIILPTNKFVVS